MGRHQRALLAGGLALGLAPWLGGCATPAVGGPPPDEAAAADEPLLVPWRTLNGGFLAPPPRPGLLPLPGTGMFVPLRAPRALALRGLELLVLDAGAPTLPQAALLLGPDLSAWVLDPLQRQVLRFARDGRLLQTWRVDRSLPSPVGFALLDQGATLLLADGMGAQWSEQRGMAGVVVPVLPRRGDGQRISGVDAVVRSTVDGEEALWVLDRLAGAVHRVRRDGQVLATLGQGELLQPEGLAVDRWGRLYLSDRLGSVLQVLQPGRPPLRVPAAQLRVQQIAGLAVDDALLAVADGRVGQVVLHRIGRPVP